MKYFFLSDTWVTGRVWEFGGLWDEAARRRKPHLQKQPLCIQENGETLSLYEAEEDILMVEVMPGDPAHAETSQPHIGQVVLKRLLTAEQVLTRLYSEEKIFHAPLSKQASIPVDPQSKAPLENDREVTQQPTNLSNATFAAGNPLNLTERAPLEKASAPDKRPPQAKLASPSPKSVETFRPSTL